LASPDKITDQLNPPRVPICYFVCGSQEKLRLYRRGVLGYNFDVALGAACFEGSVCLKGLFFEGPARRRETLLFVEWIVYRLSF
jgi:hypothetical protein